MRYGNEAEVGAAIAESGVPRDELFITTKLPDTHHGVDLAIESLTESLRTMALDRVDLYLIHWPLPKQDRFVEAWRGLIELRERGLARSIGVSNFTPWMLRGLIDETGVTPAVNQIELHPYFPQLELRALHADLGIRTQSWSPLGKGSDLLQHETVAGIAAAHGVTPAQAVLRWHIQLGSAPIPASRDAGRQRENLELFGFELTVDEVAALTALERGRLWGGDPETHG